MKMITYEKALETAKSLKRNVDACDEYEDAYCFKCREEEFEIGGAGACVVLKENGRALNQLYYFENYGGKFVREIPVEA